MKTPPARSRFSFARPDSFNTDQVWAVASSIVAQAQADRPADAILRAELKRARNLAPATGRAIARTVFDYYRWLGWLDRAQPMLSQLRRAVALAGDFAARPETFPIATLRERAIPSWLHQVMEVPDEWLLALQTEPKLWLRARSEFVLSLAAELGDCLSAQNPSLVNALCYQGEQDLFRTAAFHRGEFELQDIASQAVGYLCAPRPGETWWDACAGEGGKTLHLADLMRNRGLIWATDRVEWRLRQLKRRAARASVFNYRAATWNGSAHLPMRTKFDGILVDAPCSGIGTWQRNPQARWTTTPEDVRELASIQRALLSHVAKAVKPGGKLIYAVCTLTRTETTEVAADFTAQFPDFAPLATPSPFSGDSAHAHCFWPQKTAGNGMFVASWQRRAS